MVAMVGMVCVVAGSLWLFAIGELFASGVFENPDPGDATRGKWLAVAGFKDRAIELFAVDALHAGKDKPAPIFGNYRNTAGPPRNYDIYGREEPSYIWQLFMNNYLRGTKIEQFPPFVPLGTNSNFSGRHSEPAQTQDRSPIRPLATPPAGHPTETARLARQ